MNELPLKERVRPLRQQGQSIRQITRNLGVTKYAVEKAVKELEADSVREYFEALSLRRQTPQQPATNHPQTAHPMLPDVADALPDSAELASDAAQTWQQTAQNEHQGRSSGVYHAFTSRDFPQETQPKTAEKAEIAPKTWYFYGVYTFMAEYRVYLRQLQRLLQQNKWVWVHTLRNDQLKKTEKLQAKAQSHCLEQGLAYDALLLSEALGACDTYLRGLLSTVKVNPALYGFDSVRLTPNEDLTRLMKRAEAADSFFARRGDGVGAA